MITRNEIIKIVTDHFEIERHEIFTKSRKNLAVLPRFIIMKLLREKLKLNLSEIGRMFERDHSTAINAISKITDYCSFKSHVPIEAEHYLECLRKVDKYIITNNANSRGLKIPPHSIPTI